MVGPDDVDEELENEITGTFNFFFITLNHLIIFFLIFR